MRRLFTFGLAMTLNWLCKIFYKTNLSYVQKLTAEEWKGIRIVILLNHTSLFEPLFANAIPTPLHWRIAGHGLFPIADITFKRPVLGRFFRQLAPKVYSISRKNDDTWKNFLLAIEPEDIVLFLPEGRMKRSTGLDKSGKAMSIRSGIYDILKKIEYGKMLIAYSGGLHHVQSPGQSMPKLFKNLFVRFECIDISEYLRGFQGSCQSDKEVRLSLIRNLEEKRDLHCPELEKLSNGLSNKLIQQNQN